MSKAMSSVNKPAVVRWQMREVASFAVDNRADWEKLDRDEAFDLIYKSPDRARTEAQVKGTLLHADAETLTDPGAAPPDPETEPHQAAAYAFVTELRNRLAENGSAAPEFYPEVDVCSRDGGYHGRVDLLVIEPETGRWHVVDWKTTSKPDADGPWPDTALQVSAYSFADGWKDPETKEWRQLPHQAADSGWAVQLLPDGRYIAAECVSDEAIEAFNSARCLAAWSNFAGRGPSGTAPRPNGWARQVLSSPVPQAE